MSMKRSKEVSRGRQKDVEEGFWEKKGPERVYTFEADVAPHPEDAFATYSPAERYAKDALLLHPKFGKGIVIDVEPQKINILFEDAPRKLTHALGGGAALASPRPKPQPREEPEEEAAPEPTNETAD